MAKLDKIRCFELRLGSYESGSNACILLSSEDYFTTAEVALGHFGECLKAVIDQDKQPDGDCCASVNREKCKFCPTCGRFLEETDVFDQVCNLVQSLFASSSVDTGASWELVMQNGWDIWARDISGKDFENRRVVSEADKVIASMLVDKLGGPRDDDYLNEDEREELIEKANR
jgi:hypothetical protein